MSVDYGYAAQVAAEAHLDACEASEEAYEEALMDGVDLDHIDTPASAPYCACQTCMVREVLYAAWPVLVNGLAELLRGAGHVAAAEMVEGEA